MSIEQPKPPVRLRRTVEAARENILAAAEAILVERGPQSLKLIEVARAAEVSTASLIHHFGSIDAVQTALMARMIRQLVSRMVALKSVSNDRDVGLIALFDTFETKGAARLAAWLELTGESRQLTLVREAVGQVIAAWTDEAGASSEGAEDFVLLAINIALGVGLFGSTLSTLLGKSNDRARALALELLLSAIHLRGRPIEASVSP